jgi:hypothetical protein
MTTAPVNFVPPEDRSDLDGGGRSPTRSAPGGALSKKQIQAMEVGAGFAMLFSVSGFIVFMRFLPAPSPMASAERITQMYVDNQAGIQIGASLMLLSYCMWVSWGASLATWGRSVERGAPVLSYALIANIAVEEFVVIMIAVFWGLAAFRPGVVSPDITLTLNDAGWLMFLITWGPFSVQSILFGLLVLQDRTANPVFPRWMAGFSFMWAFVLIPAFAPLIFKEGGFAYNGILGMYIPLIAFEAWKTAVAAVAIRGYRRNSKIAGQR